MRKRAVTALLPTLAEDIVNTALWLYWDPIGCGVPPDEYMHVAQQIAFSIRERKFSTHYAAHTLKHYCRFSLETKPNPERISVAVFCIYRALREQGLVDACE